VWYTRPRAAVAALLWTIRRLVPKRQSLYEACTIMLRQLRVRIHCLHAAAVRLTLATLVDRRSILHGWADCAFFRYKRVDSTSSIDGSTHNVSSTKCRSISRQVENGHEKAERLQSAYISSSELYIYIYIYIYSCDVERYIVNYTAAVRTAADIWLSYIGYTTPNRHTTTVIYSACAIVVRDDDVFQWDQLHMSFTLLPLLTNRRC